MAKLGKTLLIVLATTMVAPASIGAQAWKLQPLQTRTRWADLVDPTHPLPEYPRPQLVREHWQNLNGLWEYTITARDAAVPTHFQGYILVPFPLESALSGVQKPLKPDQLLWYRRTVTLNPGSHGARTLLHFEAVDYQATVYLNGQEVGTHTGGYQIFTVDISDALKPGENELVVKVYDPTEAGPNPHGKQGVQYTASSGIWQTVWLETVPRTYIECLLMTPEVDQSTLNLQVTLKGAEEGYTVQAIAKIGATTVAKANVNGTTAVHINHPRLWSPDDPFLYDVEVRVLKDGKVTDEVKSYFGMRKIEVKKDGAGIDRIFLNDRYTYNLGVLDQGFWPDGLHTAPTDAALKFDIQATKAMGFNTIRRHIKIERDRWYYYCDKLGVMVWQDMVEPANSTPEARAEFEKEVPANLAQLHNHPSITIWVLFNECWNAFDQERLAHRVKQWDSSRLLDSNSGPFSWVRYEQFMRQLDLSQLARLSDGDQELGDELGDYIRYSNWVGGDMTDFHTYPYPKLPPAEPGKARVVGENGGIGVFVDGHVWNDLAPVGEGYMRVQPDQFAKTYADLVAKLKVLQAQGLSGSIYTQTYDIEEEQNGLLSYDRAIAKIPVAELAKMNSELVPQAKNYDVAVQGLSVTYADVTAEAQRYAGLLREYEQGNKDPAFLRHFTLMAIRQKDQVHATEAGNEYIDRSPQPYSKDAWTFIQVVTRTSKDKGFELLRTQTELVDAILGKNAAETTIREVIEGEEVSPHLSDKSGTPDWPAMEKAVVAKYGVLGGEAVYGAEMAYYLNKQDWSNYGKYYVLYFDTAATRSKYPVNNLSYKLFEHVSDPQILEAAIQADKHSVDKLGSDDPTEIDTYANLLYKVGRKQEAIDWEQKALQFSQERDKEFVVHLEKMKAGQPTWRAP